MPKKQPAKRNPAKGFAERPGAYRPQRPATVRKREQNFPKIPASEFAKNFGEYRERAQRCPVAVTSHGRTTGYFISAEHFEDYLRVSDQSRRVVRVVDLPKETIDAIRKARVPRKYDYLNALLDDD
jgi:hypothetical protein